MVTSVISSVSTQGGLGSLSLRLVKQAGPWENKSRNTLDRTLNESPLRTGWTLALLSFLWLPDSYQPPDGHGLSLRDDFNECGLKIWLSEI